MTNSIFPTDMFAKPASIGNHKSAIRPAFGGWRFLRFKFS